MSAVASYVPKVGDRVWLRSSGTRWEAIRCTVTAYVPGASTPPQLELRLDGWPAYYRYIIWGLATIRSSVMPLSVPDLIVESLGKE